MTIALCVGAAWLVAGAVGGMAGGFELIRRIELNKEAKTAKYWVTLLVVYPIILIRAAIWAMRETMIGGAR
jgi:hypothetical protein